ncbi:MAG: NAD-dependent epimerase/dehydratase family protein [Chloroflexota bacterium]
MRVLVTGSSGQIGTNLALRLLGDGHEVVGIDRRENTWTDSITTHVLDLSVVHEVTAARIGSAAAGEVDAVVHLAAHAKVHALVERPLGALENHVMVTNALEFARQARVPILLASSREVYGNAVTRGVPVSETAADYRSAASPYAAMKLASEALAAAYARCYGVAYAVLRFSNVYGRYDNDLARLERAIWIFARNIREGRPVPIFGADKTLDFTYVDDAVDGAYRCLARLVARDSGVVGETFNVAYGKGTRLLDVAGIIGRGLESEPTLEIEDARPGEVTWYVADISKARARLGYEPTVSISDGIPRALEWAGLAAALATG